MTDTIDPMEQLATALANAESPDDRKAILIQFTAMYAAETLLADPNFNIEDPLKEFVQVSTALKDLSRAVLAELIADPDYKEALVLTYVERLAATNN